MKQLFTLFLMTVSFVVAFAADETYVPMIREGRVWKYKSSGGLTPDVKGDYIIHHFIRFGGEVSVNGYTYRRNVIFRKMKYLHDWETDSRTLVEDLELNQTVCFMREEVGKVYTLASSKDLSCVTNIGEDTSDYYDALMYDWTKKDGDTWDYLGLSVEASPIVVRDKTPVKIEGEECRVITFDGQSNIDFVEGIGTTYNGSIGKFTIFLVSATYWVNDYEPGYQSILECVYDADGEVIYGHDSPVGVKLAGADTESKQSGVIYDLMGRRVDSPQPGSVYVRDGKKFVGR